MSRSVYARTRDIESQCSRMKKPVLKRICSNSFCRDGLCVCCLFFIWVSISIAAIVLASIQVHEYLNGNDLSTTTSLPPVLTTIKRDVESTSIATSTSNGSEDEDEDTIEDYPVIIKGYFAFEGDSAGLEFSIKTRDSYFSLYFIPLDKKVGGRIFSCIRRRCENEHYRMIIYPEIVRVIVKQATLDSAGIYEIMVDNNWPMHKATLSVVKRNGLNCHRVFDLPPNTFDGLEKLFGRIFDDNVARAFECTYDTNHLYASFVSTETNGARIEDSKVFMVYNDSFKIAIRFNCFTVWEWSEAVTITTEEILTTTKAVSTTEMVSTASNAKEMATTTKAVLATKEVTTMTE